MAVDPQHAWDSFVIFESATTIPAGHLVDHSKISDGETGLDVGCGTGVVAVTAARRGAKMSGIDPAPGLLLRAEENAALAEVQVDWYEGGAESMPFPDESFEVVFSQFGHMFAPDPSAATDEMMRVLKPGGRYLVSVWDGDHFLGLLWSVIARHGFAGLEAPIFWGNPEKRRLLLSNRLNDYRETPGVLAAPALSPAHRFQALGRAIAPMAILIDQLAPNPDALEHFRSEVLELIEASSESNSIPQRYTIVSGIKS